MTVTRWLPTALDDLSAIVEYISERNPLAASQLADRLRIDTR
jgi:plasmid stabilization system protein ParE